MKYVLCKLETQPAAGLTAMMYSDVCWSVHVCIFVYVCYMYTHVHTIHTQVFTNKAILQESYYINHLHAYGRPRGFLH